ncbi:hypothetical protein Y1Q_0004076 [Alligator mississippiensis]|uniref:Uncharacterized protein n=1 Tax=Alligator mississippiensis TaxID=8496 RepID=A0A151PIS9_ALLMI|nr:hypothetical protein Y1Q_0004076 [Alligator mississippiensis]
MLEYSWGYTWLYSIEKERSVTQTCGPFRHKKVKKLQLGKDESSKTEENKKQNLSPCTKPTPNMNLFQNFKFDQRSPQQVLTGTTSWRRRRRALVPNKNCKLT